MDDILITRGRFAPALCYARLLQAPLLIALALGAFLTSVNFANASRARALAGGIGDLIQSPTRLSATRAIGHTSPRVSPSAVSARFAAERHADASADPADSVLVYQGNESSPPAEDGEGSNASYTDLEAATGRTVETTTVLPADLSHDSCVLLQLNSEAFSAEQTATLQSYMKRGGVVVGIGEYYEYDPGADENLSALASSLGVSVSFQDDTLGSGLETATDIGPSPFAAGITSLAYAAVAGVNAEGPAQVIASTDSATGEVPFIGAQSLGGGAFVLLGDSNVLSDWSGPGYLEDGNGTLANNLCGHGGYGYSFPNKGMNQYVQGAGLHPAQVLRPSDLSATFADWNYNPVLGGALGTVVQEELEIAFGFGIMSQLWESMEGGTCYGLALSAGKFDDGAEELFSPGNGRSDPGWSVGSGLSASTLLSEPHTGLSPAYNEQFLRLDTDDFLTQFSTEVLSSASAQRQAYANSDGVAKLREQLESIMDNGTSIYNRTGSLSSAPGTGNALLTLYGHDPLGGGRTENYGHAVDVVGLETLSEGTLQIKVWDNNFPGNYYDVFVHPNGTWTYDAPYYRWSYHYFGNTYSLSHEAGYASGTLEAYPLYTPKGLHFYPAKGSGSIVDVGPSTTVSGALASDGTQPESQLIASGSKSESLSYAGEILSYDTPEGELALEGSSPSADVRGPEDYLAVSGSGPVKVKESTASGSIAASGGPVKLDVARDGLLVSSTGASALTVAGNGTVTFTADSSGHAEIVQEADVNGSLVSTTLYSGAPTPGKVITISAETGKSGEEGEVKTGVLSNKLEKPPAPAATVALAATTLKVVRKNHALLQLSCNGTATCSGKVTLTVTLRIKSGKRRLIRTEAVGSAVFSIPAGKSETVTLKLNFAGRRLLAAGHGHLGAILDIVKASPIPSQTEARAVRLVEQKTSKSENRK